VPLRRRIEVSRPAEPEDLELPEPEPEVAAAGTDETEALRRELEEERQRQLRLRADFENFRRRVVREQQAARNDGRRSALLAILPVLDTLERALQAGSRDAAFYEGVAATQRQFLAALREAGAEPIESVGTPFDPNTHEAVGTVPAAGVAAGTVVQEARRGWRLDGEVLRPAQVVVAAGPPDDQAQSGES
jgi:molecular chaperone GrpE